MRTSLTLAAALMLAPGQARAANLTTLVSFNGANGLYPAGRLMIDTDGNLLGAASSGGQYGFGEIFEILKTSSGYANTFRIVVSFNLFVNGAAPNGDLIADSNGDLFGTTEFSFGSGEGTVFEIINSAAGYSNVATTLATFNFSNGSQPSAGLTADADGNLLGTTIAGGAYLYGTVFEVANTTGATQVRQRP